MKLRKRIRALSLVILVIINFLGVSNNYIIKSKAATFDEINQPDVFLKQVNGDMQCTLVSATMLVRRAAILLGISNWADITVDNMKTQAWVNGVGLKYTFTYEGITVNKAQFGADPVNEAIALLKQHPEGIVIYDQNRRPRSHAVLLTDYTDGMFYCADPAGAVPYGRIPINQGLVQVQDAEYYYYVSSPSIPSYANSINTSPVTSVTDPTVPLVTDTSASDTSTSSIISSPSPSIVEESTIINLTDISTYNAELSQTVFYYDGSEKKPVVTISGLTEGTDFSVMYSNNMAPGNAIAVITGIGAYTGTIIKYFEIRVATIYDYFNEINFSLSKQSIKVGKTAKVNVNLPETLTPVQEFTSSDIISNEVKITYSSSNSKIAKVSSKGKITGKKKGTAKITVTAKLSDGTKKEFILTIKVK